MASSQEIQLDAAARAFQSKLPFRLPEVGEVLTSTRSKNTFTMGERIDEGGFSTVFACSDVWGEALVAKVLKPTGPNIQAILQKASDEVSMLALLRHPNILYVYEALIYHGACYIIAERCGSTLRGLISGASYDPNIWFQPVARCLLRAIDFVHRSDATHCDIHLGNIFYTFIKDEVLPDQHSAMTFKLADFGLARPTSEVVSSGTFLNAIRPPEAIDPDEYGPADQRLDIYQLGLVFLQVALGEVIVWTQQDIIDGLPRERALTLPEPYRSAIERMLRRHVMMRTPTALDVWCDLGLG